MSRADVNWSEAIGEMATEKPEDEGQPDTAEEVMPNERIRRPAPSGWSEVIRE